MYTRDTLERELHCMCTQNSTQRTLHCMCTRNTPERTLHCMYTQNTHERTLHRIYTQNTHERTLHCMCTQKHSWMHSLAPYCLDDITCCYIYVCITQCAIHCGVICPCIHSHCAGVITRRLGYIVCFFMYSGDDWWLWGLMYWRG